MSLVLSIAFTDVEGKNVSENKLFVNFKKKLFTQLGQANLAVALKTEFRACRDTCD